MLSLHCLISLSNFSCCALRVAKRSCMVFCLSSYLCKDFICCSRRRICFVPLYSWVCVRLYVFFSSTSYAWRAMAVYAGWPNLSCKLINWRVRESYWAGRSFSLLLASWACYSTVVICCCFAFSSSWRSQNSNAMRNLRRCYRPSLILSSRWYSYWSALMVYNMGPIWVLMLSSISFILRYLLRISCYAVRRRWSKALVPTASSTNASISCGFIPINLCTVPCRTMKCGLSTLSEILSKKRLTLLCIETVLLKKNCCLPPSLIWRPTVMMG